MKHKFKVDTVLHRKDNFFDTVVINKVSTYQNDDGVVKILYKGQTIIDNKSVSLIASSYYIRKYYEP